MPTLTWYLEIILKNPRSTLSGGFVFQISVEGCLLRVHDELMNRLELVWVFVDQRVDGEALRVVLSARRTDDVAVTFRVDAEPFGLGGFRQRANYPGLYAFTHFLHAGKLAAPNDALQGGDVQRDKAPALFLARSADFRRVLTDVDDDFRRQAQNFV